MMKVGPSFSEYIHTGKPSVRYHIDNAAQWYFKNWLFVVVFIVGAGILLIRLFWLQVVQGDYYRSLSDSNRIRTTVIHAPRGVIFDRNGKPLVYNVPGYREEVNGKTVFFDQASAIPLLAKGDTHLEVDSLRQYPLKDAESHVVGYVGEISASQLQSLGQDYKAGDIVGKAGIEQSYESVLRGLDGQTLIEVDATGKKLRTLGTTDPIPGQNITLTLDSTLQQKVYESMKSVKKGAAIVSKPDGEILAMVSTPTFDPNLFTMGQHYTPNPSDTYQKVSQVLLDGDGQPLLNRAIGGQYPPGSTFKLVTAAAALEEKIIDASFTVDDTGILQLGTFSFANWYFTQYGKTEGLVDVVKAIKRSNDIFFYKVGQMVGVDRLSAFAQKFGLGHMLGIDLRGEATGLVPTKEWKQKVVGDNWYVGDDYHYGIGQGYLLTTPLQVNSWTQAIANGGTLYLPHLLKTSPHVLQSNLLSSGNFDLIRQGMIEACSTGGVAWPLFNYKIPVACKTGTAQHGDDNTLPHAWITLFAPAYHPQVVVTVLAEDSGEGSNVAGPIAKQILDAYFGN